ncbi:MAG: 4-hydroxybutyrate CoA-transferase, partial [Rhodoferax sp.]|nr:4-hydroxybutyrate CoA-transferase [Rhodoferax sp.]
MSVQDLYAQKKMTASAAVRLVHDGDMIIVPTGVGEPPALLTALSEQRRDFHDVKVAQILAVRKFGYIDPDTVAHVRHVALFYGAATRAGGQAGWIDFIPNYFSEIPSLIGRGQMPADVVFSMASPMDAHGYFSLSLGADYTMAAVAKARAVVLEVNPNVPFAYGNCHVHISQVAGLVESDEAVLEVGLPKIGPVQQAIGKY